ncbi:MAG: hypothetical protein ACYDB5_10670 [bacterium]
MLTKDFIFLNSDEIGMKINSKDPASVKLKAGKKFIELLNLYINNNKQILIKSTLAGKYLLNHIKYAKDKGFNTSLIYLYIDSANEAMLRVQSRVKLGGHNIPFIDIERRYYRSIV